MILTNAVSGIARSGATRSGYPVLQGAQVPLYALSNVARSGATRSNYTSTKPFISIGGIQRGWNRGYVPGTTYRELVLADGAANYWRLDETSGTTAVDVIGGANGTISGGVTLNQPGALSDGDKAVTFDGTTGKVVTAGNVTLPVLMSLEAWVKPTKVSSNPIFASGSGQAPTFYVNAQQLTAFNPGSGAANGLVTISTGAWHHVVYVVDGSVITFYVDGVLDRTVAFVRGAPAVNVANIGGDPAFGAAAAAFWQGSLDDVAIYPVALTPAQIAAHYQTGVNGPTRASGGILAESLTKSDAINTTPVTVAFTARGWVPVEGSDVVITLGSINNGRREFGGTILSTRHRYAAGNPIAENMLYDVACIDYTWGLDRRKASGSYTNASVAAIAASLLTFAPGYTLLVDADIGAEIVDAITFTEQVLSGAFTQLAKRVGGSFLCDYSKVVHLFYENTQLSPPEIVNAVHASLATITFTRDLSQVVTRCLGSFGGANALEQIAPGATLLPVETAAWYLAAGGTVLVGQQRVTYSGIVTGGGGSLVGPGAGPTGAPNASLLPGAGVDVGSHDYAVTYKTAAGESIPGPRLTVPVGVFLPPPIAPTPGPPGPGVTGPDPGVHDYAVSFVISTGETTPGPRVVGATDLTPPPTVGPTAALGPEGPGPEFGPHDYAVTFTTAAGETTPSPIGSGVTTGSTPIPPPTTAPTLNPAISGGAIDYGSHAYGVAFVTAYGETTLGPTVSVTIGAGSLLNPAGIAPTLAQSTTGQSGWMPPGTTVYYAFTWATASGETLQSLNAAIVTVNWPSNPVWSWDTNVTVYGSTDPRCTSVKIYRNSSAPGQAQHAGQWMLAGSVANNLSGGACPTFDDSYQTAGAAPPAVNTTDPNRTVPVTNIPRGSSNVTARKLYRSVAGTMAMHLVTTLADNTTTSYTDALADAALGAGAQGTNTALGTVAVLLTSIDRATGTSNAAGTARKLYRRSGGAGLRYLATIANNSSTTYTDTASNASLGAAPPVANTATLRVIPLSAIPLGNSLVTARKVYRTPANTGGGTLKLVATIADNTTTAYTDTVNDAALGAAALTVGTAQAAQVQLSAIPLGAAAVTARVLYRTKAGLSQLQLLTTLADNTTTTWLDTAVDTSLGANAPTSDTSTLQQPQGNVLAGSPTLPCASVAAFRATGGWAIVGSQNVRYTGISGNAITGIPATGPGAITATITYNTTVVAAAMLIGIPPTGLGVIKYTVLKGDPVNLFVQVDDLDAQAAVRAQLAGSDGIIEDEIVDGRLGYLEGRERCQARLDLLGARDSEGKVGIVTVSYVCRDLNTHAGATVTVNIGPPINLRGDYLIQRVSVAQFNIPNLNPTYTVEASSIRFSAEEMLRLLRQGAF